MGSSEGIAVVDVQAMASMDELVDALLPLNLIPLVVPEFKGITVGGSIQGSAPPNIMYCLRIRKKQIYHPLNSR